MSKNAFAVEGDFQMGRIRQHFVIECVAENEDMAREYVYADLGSRHSVKRRQVEITGVTAVKLDDADPITQHKLK